jgi:hypothetical protein
MIGNLTNSVPDRFNGASSVNQGFIQNGPMNPLDRMSAERTFQVFGDEIKSGFQKAGITANDELVRDFIFIGIDIGKTLKVQHPGKFAAGLMKLMSLESKFNPTITNQLGYKGLIQFSPSNQKIYPPHRDPLKQLSESVRNYLVDNNRNLSEIVKQADVSDNGARTLTSVFTGPGARGLENPTQSSTSDENGTTVSKYYSNIKQGMSIIDGEYTETYSTASNSGTLNNAQTGQNGIDLNGLQASLASLTQPNIGLSQISQPNSTIGTG